MKANISCHMIKDLLPLYLDELVSEETAAEINEHLQNCSECKEYYEHMKADVLGEQTLKQEESRKEINYLKKIKNTTKKVVLGAAVTLLLCVLTLFAKLFIIGSPNENYYTTYIDVYDDMIRVGGTFTGSAAVYSRYQIKETDKGSQLVIYTCLPSFWNREGVFNLDIPKDQIKGTLSIGEITVAENGTIISALANRIYDAKNPYIGDASADGRLTGTLGISEELGSFKNELQTSTEPYGWTLRFDGRTTNSRTAIYDEKMRGFACILIALTDNLGEVKWELTVEQTDDIPVTRVYKMTKEDCTKYLGADVKSYGESPETVQELLQRLEELGIVFPR